jgi:hypothetical protein
MKGFISSIEIESPRDSCPTETGDGLCGFTKKQPNELSCVTIRMYVDTDKGNTYGLRRAVEYGGMVELLVRRCEGYE